MKLPVSLRLVHLVVGDADQPVDERVDGNDPRDLPQVAGDGAERAQIRLERRAAIVWQEPGATVR